MQWLLDTAGPFLNHVGWDLQLENTLAVCVRGQDVDGVEEGTQNPGRVGLPMCLHWSPVHRSPYSGLRESTKRGMEGRKGEKKMGLQYWVIYLD